MTGNWRSVSMLPDVKHDRLQVEYNDAAAEHGRRMQSQFNKDLTRQVDERMQGVHVENDDAAAKANQWQEERAWYLRQMDHARRELAEADRVRHDAQVRLDQGC